MSEYCNAFRHVSMVKAACNCKLGLSPFLNACISRFHINKPLYDSPKILIN